MTVKTLYLLCQKQIEKGNADKEIYLPIDDEGNGYRHLYFGFLDEKIEEYVEEFELEDDKHSFDNIVILG